MRRRLAAFVFVCGYWFSLTLHRPALPLPAPLPADSPPRSAMEAPRKPRFEKNPMQAQMEAKKKKEEEEAAKKAQGAGEGTGTHGLPPPLPLIIVSPLGVCCVSCPPALAAKLAMWGEPAKGTKKAVQEEVDDSAPETDDAASDKPKRLDPHLRNLARSASACPPLCPAPLLLMCCIVLYGMPLQRV